MRALTSLLGNSQRLDGGAMFGNAPQPLWSRWFRPDAENRIELACRCLLVRQEGRTVLCETGIGAFFDPENRRRYGVAPQEHRLLESLARVGLRHEDIDVVVLSHLHFDHAGGLLDGFAVGAAPRLLFPRASFLVSQTAWQRAQRPHARDRASFIPHLVELLEASGRVEQVTQSTSHLLGPGYKLHYSDGHTPGLLCTEMEMPQGPVLFASDLVPGTAWVHVPITMGYDRFAEQLIDEKRELLTDLRRRGGRLFFTHDPAVALARLGVDARGRFIAEDPCETIDDLVE